MVQIVPTPKTKTLFEIWQEHCDNGSCSKSFSNWCNFRNWFLENKVRLDDVEQLTELSEEAYEKLHAKEKIDEKSSGNKRPADEAKAKKIEDSKVSSKSEKT